MKKRAYFDSHDGPGWPDQSWLAKYFLTRSGRRQFFALGNDSWGLTAEGVDGTEHLPRPGRIDIDLTILGSADLGILLFYHRMSVLDGVSYYSRGDLRRLHEWVTTKDGDLMPIGLFIPFETAWNAIKEFMETDGALPKCIDWIPARDLPVDVFPDQYDQRKVR
jgi:Immunity protein Imm1